MNSANVKAIQDAVEHSLIDGVTTNPSLIAKEGRNFREVVEDLSDRSRPGQRGGGRDDLRRNDG
jgi:transaldolase